MNTIAYQGIEGSFSHLAATQLQGMSKGFRTFREAFEAVENGQADYALLPIENTLAGTIYETIDLLNEGNLQIVGEIRMRIEHSLLGTIGSSVGELRSILSHPKALAQCTRFFSEHPWIKPIPHYDTAGAAADAASAQDPSCAAIAHRAAAQIYGLKPLVDGIQDHAENFTRFFLLSKTGIEGNKGSLCLTLPHKPGSLANILGIFALHEVNLTYLVSRPLIGKPFEYLFYMDFEHSNLSFLNELRENTNSLKIFGAYTERDSKIGIAADAKALAV